MDDHRDARFDRLSPRMRDCLRLAYDRKTNKQIGAVLGLEEGTVKGYVAEAVRILGARGKVDAAELLHEREAGDPAMPGPPPPPAAMPPSKVEVSSGGAAAAEVATLAPALPSGAPWGRSMPLRPQGAANNDLTALQRVAWLLLIAFGLAIGFGAVATGVRVIDDLARGGGSRHHAADRPDPGPRRGLA